MLSNDIPQALASGTILQSGAFELQSALGRGGFGITYAAQDVRLERAVAIKEFFPEGCARNENSVAPGTLSDDDFRAAMESFEDEARTLARFAHPNIVDVYTVFEENHTAYMVMEFLRGASLQQIVEAEGALSPDEAIALVMPICDALETVHGAGLLHGDITPTNVMRTETNRVVLLDFGLTKRIAQAGYATMRLSNTRLGTAGYAPLEQYGRQAKLNASADIYSLAATVFFLLIGAPPPEATDRATGVALPNLRATNPAVNENLARAIYAGLEMEPNARPQSARAFCESLADAQANAQNVAPLQVTVRAPQPDDTDEGEWQHVERYEEPRRIGNDPLLDLLFGGAPGPEHLPVPQRFPQGRQRRSAQQRDPFNLEPRPFFILPGCTSGCGVGCIILLFFGFVLLSFLSSLLQPVGYVIGF